MQFEIKNNTFLLSDIPTILDLSCKLTLSAESVNKIIQCRQYLENKLSKSDQLFYGINTGFGALCNVRIHNDNIEILQSNLVKSHALGTGDKVPEELIRLIMFFKILSLSKAYSGVRIELVNRLIEFFNHDIYPAMYQLGSLGASGDLVPLAHLALGLLGEGNIFRQGETKPVSQVLDYYNIKPLNLKAKEGLALLNGTQFSCAYAAWCCYHANQIINKANYISAISVLAFNGKIESFDPEVSAIRNQKGQQWVAKQILEVLLETGLKNITKESLQDPYSFRCVPQVHGASKDTIDFVSSIIEREINAVSDNPNIFPDSDKIISSGNFHAQSIALSADYLAIALAEVCNISERRTYQLLSGSRHLPEFLIQKAGLNSGLMIAQYTAASIVNQNKFLCTPCSVDSIVTSNGQEDHVSMSANSATKCYKIVENCYRILGIELMVNMQALEFGDKNIFSKRIQKSYSRYREFVDPLTEDRALYEDLEKTIKFVKSGL